MTPQEQQAIDTALAVVQTVGPELGPNGAIAAAIVTAGAAAIKAATSTGADVTDEQLAGVFDQYKANQVDDRQAQRDARAAGDTTGEAIPPG